MWYRILFLLGCLALSALAQTTASINGFVFDQNEAALPKARVTLANGERKQTATTDANGAFRFEKLAAGDYEIKVEREGFQAVTTPVNLGARVLAPLRIVLPVADLQQDVTISDATTQVDTDTSNNQNVVSIGKEALNKLPAFDQDPIAAVSSFLDAGATGTGGVTLIVDGVEVKKLGVTSSAIQEVKINNNPYSAEYARQGRGRVEVITKPAVAQLHGEFNWTFRDARFNARDPFALVRAPEQRRMYEGNLTGPLNHDKKRPTNFLITAEHDEQDIQAVIYAITPTGELRQNAPTPSRQNEFAMRVTRQMTDKTALSVLYSYEDRNARNQGVGGYNLAETATDTRFREQEARVAITQIVTPKLVHQINFLVGHYAAPTVSLNNAPRIVVQDFFTGGGAQADFTRTESHGEYHETFAYQAGKQFIKTGVQIPDISLRGIFDRTNQQGTFYFASLDDYKANKPYNFIQQQGRADLHFWENIVGTFVLDEIRVRPALSLSLGLRHDWQNYFGDHNNFAPRFGFAYAPGKARKTVVRGGAGIFYDRTGPQPISDFLRFDGTTLRRFVIPNPGFPNPLANGQTLVGQPVSIVRLDPQVVIPTTAQYGVGIERQLQKSLTLAVNYIGSRGVNLFRSRDVNASLQAPFTLRPNPAFSYIRQIESTAHSVSNALEVSLRGKVSKYFNGTAQYVYGYAHNDTGGVASFPANSYDLTSEWGRADYDFRHRFGMKGSFNVRDYFDLGMSLELVTGAPYSLTTGRDTNGDSFALDRPAGVRRNTLQGPGLAQLDLRWSREFKLGNAKKDKAPTLAVRADFFNVLNRVNFTSLIGNRSSDFFGKPVAARPVRRMQFGVSVSF
jgi:Carboxypeptidase regulatory-like domain